MDEKLKKLFICVDPTNREISQAYLYQFAPYVGKFPQEYAREQIYTHVGGLENFLAIHKIIDEQIEIIKKNFSDIIIPPSRSDLEDIS